MSVQRSILEAMIARIDALGLYSTMNIGALPAANGLSIAPAAGGVDENTLAHGGQYSMSCSINGKHTSQATVYDALCTIHETLEKLSTYTTGPNYAVTGVKSVGAPAYLDHEADGYLYGSSIRIEFIID